MNHRPRPEPQAVLIGRAARRLGAQAAALVALVVVGLTAIAVLVVVNAQHDAATALLHDAVAHADDVNDPPNGVYLVRRQGADQDVSAGMPAGAEDDDALVAVAAGAGVPAVDRYVGSVEYRVATVRHADGVTVQGILDLTVNHAERDRLVATMLAGGVAGLLVAAAAGTWLGRRALRPLSAALALQRRFVADAGHELRTPLTLLGTRAQLLRRRVRRTAIGSSTGPGDDVPDSGAAALLGDADGIVGDTRRLTEILEDLLLAADPLAERPREAVDLVVLGHAAVDAAAAAAAGRGVELTGPWPVGAVAVSGSPVALRRALTALLDNALRHASSTVQVTVGTAGREALVDVSDDGPGVDPAVAGRIFDRFATAPASVAGPRRYGLGLALVAEIAAAHGGRVELVTRRGPGTTIRLAIPLA